MKKDFICPKHRTQKYRVYIIENTESLEVDVVQMGSLFAKRMDGGLFKDYFKVRF